MEKIHFGSHINSYVMRNYRMPSGEARVVLPGGAELEKGCEVEELVIQK